MLTLLQTQVQTGDCTLAEGTATKIDEAIANLPNSVDPKVQDALSKGAENLTQLANDSSQCVEGGATGASGDTTDSTDSSTTDSTSTPTTTESTTTTTTSTDTSTPEQNTPQQPTGPPGHDEGQTPPTGDGAGGDNVGGPRSGGVTPGGKK